MSLSEESSIAIYIMVSFEKQNSHIHITYTRFQIQKHCITDLRKDTEYRVVCVVLRLNARYGLKLSASKDIIPSL